MPVEIEDEEDEKNYSQMAVGPSVGYTATNRMVGIIWGLWFLFILIYFLF